MSSSHEHEFSPSRVLDKPTVAGSGTGNEIFFPQLGQPVKRPGQTATPRPTELPSTTPTATEAPSKTPTATSTETPPPTETPTRKEVLWIKNDVRAYEATMPADPYSPSRRLGTLTGTADSDQVRIEVNPDDKDSGWILAKGTPVAYRFVYTPYGSQAGKGPASPLQEPVILEIRIEDLQAHGLLDRLPDPQEHVYGGKRTILKQTMSGAGLSTKAVELTADVRTQQSDVLTTSQAFATLAIAGSLNSAQNIGAETMTRRRLLGLGAALGLGALLGKSLLGEQEPVSASSESGAEPVPSIIYNPELRLIPSVDPAFEVPQENDFTVHSVSETKNGEIGIVLIPLGETPDEIQSRIAFSRGEDGKFHIDIKDVNGNRQTWYLRIPQYVPIDNSLVEFKISLNPERDTITTIIFDANGEHTFTVPLGKGFSVPAFKTESWSLDPKNASVYSAIHFDADPNRLSALATPEPPARLAELDALTHRSDALTPDPKKQLWTTSQGIQIFAGDKNSAYVPDWSRNGAEIDGATSILHTPQGSNIEASMYFLNESVGITLDLSPYGYKELEDWLKARSSQMLRIADIESITDGRPANPLESTEVDFDEADSQEVASKVGKFLTALQLDRKPDSLIRLGLRGFFSKTGQLSKYVQTLGNVSDLPTKLNQTAPAGTEFNHSFMLGDVRLDEAYIKNLTITIGALIKGGLPMPTLIANSIPPQGVSVEDHVVGRQHLAEAMKALGVTVGAENVQGGEVPFATEARLNGPDLNPRGIPSPSILAPASEVGMPHAHQPYRFVRGTGLVLDQQSFAELHG